MLLLARKVGEAVVIGEGVSACKVTVARITKQGCVTLQFDAANAVPIVRDELLTRDFVNSRKSSSDYP